MNMVKKKKITNNYIDNQVLYQELVKYHEELATNPDKRIPNSIGRAIQLIATNFGVRNNFRNYTYLDEMILSAIEDCIKAVPKYDITRTNPHAFFTKITYFAFIRIIQKEKKESYVKDRLMVNMEIQGLLQNNAVGDDGHDIKITRNNMNDDLIEKFESKKKKTKKPSPKKGDEGLFALFKDKE